VNKSTSGIYLVSIPRSGATLLAAMLNAHPDIAMFNEPWVFLMARKYGTLRRRYNIQLLVDDMCASASKFGYKVESHFKEKVIADLFDRRERLTYLEAIGIVLSNFANSIGKRRWGVKQPLGIYYMPELIEYLPETRIVHIVRDPRSTVAYRMGKTNTSSGDHALALRFAKSWSDCISFSKRLFSLGNMNYFELKYEDLVIDPETWLRRICEFLGIEFAKEMLTYYRAPILYGPKDDEGNPLESHRDVALPVHTFGLTAWHSLLSPKELEIIQMICSKEMEWYNYKPTDVNCHMKKTQLWQVYVILFKRRFSHYVRVELLERAFHILRRAYIFMTKA
jgi:hypothetical protein